MKWNGRRLLDYLSPNSCVKDEIIFLSSSSSRCVVACVFIKQNFMWKRQNMIRLRFVYRTPLFLVTHIWLLVTTNYYRQTAHRFIVAVFFPFLALNSQIKLFCNFACDFSFWEFVFVCGHLHDYNALQSCGFAQFISLPQPNRESRQNVFNITAN